MFVAALSSATSAPAALAPAALTFGCLLDREFGNFSRCHFHCWGGARFHADHRWLLVKQRFNPLLSGFHPVFTLKTGLLDDSASGPSGLVRVHLLGFVHHDAFEFFFFVEEIR